MQTAYINRIATAVPASDFHALFARFADRLLTAEPRLRSAFARMSAHSGIEHRYSVLSPADREDALDGGDFYVAGRFPATAERMRAFVTYAPDLAVEAIERLDLGDASPTSSSRAAPASRRPASTSR